MRQVKEITIESMIYDYSAALLGNASLYGTELNASAVWDTFSRMHHMGYISK